MSKETVLVKAAENRYPHMQECPSSSERVFRFNERQDSRREGFVDGYTAALNSSNPGQQDQKDKEIAELRDAIKSRGIIQEEDKAEIERLKVLIEKAHSEGYEDAVHHVEYSKSLREFKIENKL